MVTVVLLVNNLGSISQLELGGIVKEGTVYFKGLAQIDILIPFSSHSIPSKQEVYCPPGALRNIHGA